MNSDRLPNGIINLNWTGNYCNSMRIKNCRNVSGNLCNLYRNEPALYELQFDQGGFEWIDLNHRADSVIAFRRKGKNPDEDILVILNMTPEVRNDWTIEVRGKSSWKEIFNSDDKKFWGTGNVFNPALAVTVKDEKEMIYEIKVHLPPLGGIVLR